MWQIKIIGAYYKHWDALRNIGFENNIEKKTGSYSLAGQGSEK